MELEVTATEEVPEDVLARILALSDADLAFRRAGRLSFRSLSTPVVIMLSGAFLAWRVLEPGARSFLERLGQRSADHLADRYAKRPRVSDELNADKFAQLTKVVQSAVSTVRRPTRIELYADAVGVDVPIALVFCAEDAEELAHMFATFILSREAVEGALQDGAVARDEPLRPIRLVVSEAGDLKLLWMDRKRLENHEREVAPPQADTH